MVQKQFEKRLGSRAEVFHGKAETNYWWLKKKRFNKKQTWRNRIQEKTQNC